MNAQTPGSPSTSHYPTQTVKEKAETHTLSVLVDNEPGVLARVIGLFSGRGYNIESLTVSETEHLKHLSLITVVTTGTPMVIEQIKNQLDRLVPVHRVVDMTSTGNAIERELAMVKVAGKGENRVEALRLADAFRARVIDASTGSFVFEITGKSDKIEQFIALMLPLGLVEVARTGIAAIVRGPEAM
ncbi:MAG: acetolactate synthase small subunit [Pseudolabrys sp.]|nr:acetolactate synthase small subunit [Pseudolabrys sp.]